MKYSLVKDSFVTMSNGVNVYRIIADSDIRDETGLLIVPEGTTGGYVQSLNNLSQEGSCWIFDDSACFGNGRIEGHATVCGKSIVKGDAVVRKYATVEDASTISGNAIIEDLARVSNCVVSGKGAVRGHAKVSKSTIKGEASVGGLAVINNVLLGGKTQIHGDVTISSAGEATFIDCTVDDGGKIRRRSAPAEEFE